MRRSDLLFNENNKTTEDFAEFLRDIGIPGNNLPEIDNALQARFFQKKADGTPAERWELKEVEVGCPISEIHLHLAHCGFYAQKVPNHRQYDYAAWPGALVSRAAGRLSELINAWTNGVRWGKTIVFGGKRPLQPDKESYGKCCEAIGLSIAQESSAHWTSWCHMEPKTELDMMRWLWANHRYLPRHLDGSLIVSSATFVDAPMKPPAKEGGQPLRPTTEDTVNEWLKSNPKPGSVLLSSGAPYGMAMDEAFWMLLEPYGFTVETFGHAAPDLPIENFMREVAGCVNRIRRARGL